MNRKSFDAFKYIQCVNDAALSVGLRLRTGENFNQYIEVTSSTIGKSPTDPSFRPDCSRLEADRAFWIVGEDQKGRVAHVQALRLDDLRTTNLAGHLESLKAFYTDPKSRAGAGSSCSCLAPTAQTMSGMVAYHGDLWLREDFRGLGLPSTLASMAFGLAWAKWSPDFIYALVPSWIIEKGIADQYGYLNREAQGAVLTLPDRGVKEDDWLLWLTRSELSQRIKAAKTPVQGLA
ncbi:hypothetical protein [Mesorhizobium sp. 43Arga]